MSDSPWSTGILQFSQFAFTESADFILFKKDQDNTLLKSYKDKFEPD